MPRKLIEIPALHTGVPYSYVAMVPAGSMAFTAGACPLDENGNVVGEGDLAAQTRQALVRLLLLPVLLRLLGDKAWWLPEPLDRLLPDVRFGHA